MPTKTIEIRPRTILSAFQQLIPSLLSLGDTVKLRGRSSAVQLALLVDGLPSDKSLAVELAADISEAEAAAVAKVLPYGVRLTFSDEIDPAIARAAVVNLPRHSLVEVRSTMPDELQEICAQVQRGTAVLLPEDLSIARARVIARLIPAGLGGVLRFLDEPSCDLISATVSELSEGCYAYLSSRWNAEQAQALTAMLPTSCSVMVAGGAQHEALAKLANLKAETGIRLQAVLSDEELAAFLGHINSSVSIELSTRWDNEDVERYFRQLPLYCDVSTHVSARVVTASQWPSMDRLVVASGRVAIDSDLYKRLQAVALEKGWGFEVRLVGNGRDVDVLTKRFADGQVSASFAFDRADQFSAPMAKAIGRTIFSCVKRIDMPAHITPKTAKALIEVMKPGCVLNILGLATLTKARGGYQVKLMAGSGFLHKELLEELLKKGLNAPVGLTLPPGADYRLGPEGRLRLSNAGAGRIEFSVLRTARRAEAFPRDSLALVLSLLCFGNTFQIGEGLAVKGEFSFNPAHSGYVLSIYNPVNFAAFVQRFERVALPVTGECKDLRVNGKYCFSVTRGVRELMVYSGATGEEVGKMLSAFTPGAYQLMLAADVSLDSSGWSLSRAGDQYRLVVKPGLDADLKDKLIACLPVAQLKLVDETASAVGARVIGLHGGSGFGDDEDEDAVRHAEHAAPAASALP